MIIPEVLQWVTMLLLVVMIACPLQETEAVLGIPKFLEMGKCAKVPLKEHFDPVKYSGLWFDIESVPNEYQHTKKCVTQNYSWKDDFMNVNTRGLTTEDKKVRQGAIMRVTTAKVAKPNPAHMTVEATGVPAAPYQIVSSDYRTYSCVYSCLEYFGFRAEFFWIFGRTPNLPAEKIRLCHTTFESLGIDYKKMVPIVQGEICPYAEKLDQMLQENEQYLTEVLGPYLPTSSVPTPLPLTTLPPETQTNRAVEEELKEIKEMVQEEKKVVEELEKTILKDPKDNPLEQPQSDDPNIATSNIYSSPTTMVILLLSVFLTALLQN